MPRVRIQTVEALPGYRLRLGLSDGRTIERDFAAEVAAPIGPMDAALQDPQFFAQVRVDPEVETVVWPNGYDMDPDVLIWGVDADGNLLAPVEPAAQGKG
jgi:uncharacterized protein DUF2442